MSRLSFRTHKLHLIWGIQGLIGLKCHKTLKIHKIDGEPSQINIK